MPVIDARTRTLLTAALALSLVVAATPAGAGGFYAPYQSGPALGTALAGATARNDDPSFLFFNAASAAATKSATVYIGAQVFSPSIKLDVRNATSPLMVPITADGSSGEMAETAIAPSFAAAIPLAEGLVLGITGNAPFAAKIEANPTWAGRFQLLRTDMKTTNVTSTLSYQVAPWLAIGAGMQVQEFDGKFEKTELAFLPGLQFPIEARGFLTGKDWGFGAVAGLMLTPADGTRIGISYRSRIRHDFEGRAGLYLPFVPRDTAKYDLVMPDVVSIGLEQRVTPALRLFAEVEWVNWSVFKGFDIALGSGLRDVRPQDWEDTFMAAVGFGYMVRPGVELTAGIHYDTAVTQGGNTFSPDSDRIMVGIGLNTDLGSHGRLSLHYAHLFFDGSAIDVADVRTGTMQADFKGSLDVFGATYRYSW